jgi:hypothetical protein
MSKRKANAPLSRSGTSARWGGTIGRGSVVKTSDGRRGIVLRLLPLNNYSRAYGREAQVAFYSKNGRVNDYNIGIGDLTVVGSAKRVPRVGPVTIPPHPLEVAHHERLRDVRRVGQGAAYDPTADYNVGYERPLPGHTELRVVRRRRK